MELPAGHHLERIEQWSDRRLLELMSLFQAEDARLGSSRLRGNIEWPNLVHVLIRTRSDEAKSEGKGPPSGGSTADEAIAYIWSQSGARLDDHVDEANLPRIHHLFVREGCRRARLGIRLLHWWKCRYALTLEAFAVTKPNKSMHSLLQRNGCTHVLQRSGFEGSAEHFHGLALKRR